MANLLEPAAVTMHLHKKTGAHAVFVALSLGRYVNLVNWFNRFLQACATKGFPGSIFFIYEINFEP